MNTIALTQGSALACLQVLLRVGDGAEQWRCKTGAAAAELHSDHRCQWAALAIPQANVGVWMFLTDFLIASKTWKSVSPIILTLNNLWKTAKLKTISIPRLPWDLVWRGHDLYWELKIYSCCLKESTWSDLIWSRSESPCQNNLSPVTSLSPLGWGQGSSDLIN